jgi:hypothetical protein
MLHQQVRGAPFRAQQHPPARSVALLRPVHAVATPASAPATSAIPVAPHAAPAFKVAIDFKALKDNLQAVVQNCRDRNSQADPERAVQLYDEFVKLKGEVDGLRAERNANAAQMKVRCIAVASHGLANTAHWLRHNVWQQCVIHLGSAGELCWLK